MVTGCTTTSPQTLVNSNTYTETNINDYSVAAFATCPLNSSEIGLLPDINIGTLTPKFQPNSTSKKQLTVYEANEWLQIVRASLPHEAPAINLPNFEKKIFFAIFDGTYNDRDDESLPPTVPAKLSLQLEELSKIRSDIEVKYYNGVGTRVNWFNKLYEGITGEGSVDRAEIAFDDLVDYSDVISDTPHVYAIGFSRGAASARHFLNLANEHLIQHDDSSNRALGLSNSRSFGLLFDTVATGQADNLNLRIGKNTISVLHLISQGERRIAFPVTSVITEDLGEFARKRINEISLPGVHSDIGGGYGEGLETLSLNLAIDWLTLQGIPLKKVEVDPRAITNLGKNNSDWFLTPLTYFIKSIIYDSDRTNIYLKPNKEKVEEDRNNVSVESIKRYIEASDFNLGITMAYTSRVAVALSNNLELLKSGPDPTQNISNVVSVMLQIHDEKLYIKTNCPDNVGFDLTTKSILLNNRVFEKLDANLVKHITGAPGGIVLVYYSENIENFKSIGTP